MARPRKPRAPIYAALPPGLKDRYRQGDLTALLHALTAIEERPLEDAPYFLPQWFLVALRAAVMAQIENQRKGATGNVLRRLLARAEDHRRTQLFKHFKKTEDLSNNGAYKMVARVRAAETGEHVSPEAIRQSCRRIGRGRLRDDPAVYDLCLALIANGHIDLAYDPNETIGFPPTRFTTRP